ncbi:MAG: L,D-transpeptidase, partial [Lachnospiraceae bacterium]|nr:L,D-transpeptidase [Lachnospiraceae bacterium]
ASWRKKFGGTEYLKNGSHGCINVPPEVMPNLYEFIYKGMPVVAFY